MKRLAKVWNAIESRVLPPLEPPEPDTRTLGFQPAYLDVATMRIHAGSPEASPATGGTVIAGFERRGFFYTRREATRACREWGFGD